ncbi:CehA/McbA family metallohydrolase [Clostridium sp. 19966]|uniref:CehA/McbA family metallohydrolase n=1 Tax=Clostridium sp. 19966 TaxID=2768166 RepID=UPI0028DF3C89|nr:CehA/McbA family metallohydrolase [Clostridium sp. 19966]MDT8719066.1 CehA/McbA family metallohydrolase [Clostridium sp. 19966]
MLAKFTGDIGSHEKLPIKIHKFNIYQTLTCLQLDINTDRQSWMQVFLWDEENRLRLQCLHLTKETKIIIDKMPEKTSTCAVPGDFLPGEYTIEIMCRNMESIEYSLEITENLKEPKEEIGIEVWCDGNYEVKELTLNNYDFFKRKKQGFKWYKGDFHTHTTLSDGKMTVKERTENAVALGLDFFVTTEHNVMPCHWTKENILVIPGMEITSPSSHFNAIGLKQWIDLRANSKDGGMMTEEGMNRLLVEAEEKGALRSINHPELYPWQWLYEETLIENIDTIEIINDPTYQQNREATEKALRLWTLLWMDGRKIWGIGGSDSHLLPTETYKDSAKPSLIGDPGTYVLAEGLSAAEIIEGVSLGRVYVSRDTEMSVKIKCNAQEYYLGSDLSEQFASEDTERSISYEVNFRGIEENCILSVIEDGKIIKSLEIEKENSYKIDLMWKGTAYTWNRLELRRISGELILFTNPIFKGKTDCKIFKWGQLIELAGGH